MPFQTREVSTASDVYALGMTMFEMVTGLKPVQSKHLTYFNPLLHWNPADKPELAAFIAKKNDPDQIEYLIARMLEDV